jgi:hypothetical protein
MIRHGIAAATLRTRAHGSPSMILVASSMVVQMVNVLRVLWRAEHVLCHLRRQQHRRAKMSPAGTM